MKICMIVQSYYVRDPRVRREAEALTEAGHKVDVISLKDEGEKTSEVVEQVTVYRFPIRRKRGNFLRYMFEYGLFFSLSGVVLVYLYLRHHYHIVHLHNMPDFLVFCTIIPKLLGAKIILDVHDPMPEVFSSRFQLDKEHWLLQLLRFQERLSYHYPHLLLTVNEPMRKRLIARGVQPSRVKTLLNSPDLKIFPRTRNGVVKEDDRFILVYTGTIAERFGLDIAIQGVKILAEDEDMDDVRLLIVGEGNCLGDLRELVEELNLHQHVMFRRKVLLEEIPGILTECDVGISPHRNGPFEELCLYTKILESLAMGLPVISSRTRTVEHYLGDSIFFFESEDVNGFAEQVRLIRQNPQLVADKMQKAERKLRELSWDREKEKLQQLVMELASGENR